MNARDKLFHAMIQSNSNEIQVHCNLEVHCGLGEGGGVYVMIIPLSL